jgi:hypothetical protein
MSERNLFPLNGLLGAATIFRYGQSIQGSPGEREIHRDILVPLKIGNEFSSFDTVLLIVPRYVVFSGLCFFSVVLMCGGEW